MFNRNLNTRNEHSARYDHLAPIRYCWDKKIGNFHLYRWGSLRFQLSLLSSTIHTVFCSWWMGLLKLVLCLLPTHTEFCHSRVHAWELRVVEGSLHADYTKGKSAEITTEMSLVCRNSKKADFSEGIRQYRRLLFNRRQNGLRIDWKTGCLGLGRQVWGWHKTAENPLLMSRSCELICKNTRGRSYKCCQV